MRACNESSRRRLKERKFSITEIGLQIISPAHQPNHKQVSKDNNIGLESMPRDSHSMQNLSIPTHLRIDGGNKLPTPDLEMSTMKSKASLMELKMQAATSTVTLPIFKYDDYDEFDSDGPANKCPEVERLHNYSIE